LSAALRRSSFITTLNIEVSGGWHIPGILPAAATFMMAIVLLAAAGPARRAIRVNPTEALRDA
jgi:ABC-type lipoprotein release transport system permease subunit